MGLAVFSQCFARKSTVPTFASMLCIVWLTAALLSFTTLHKFCLAERTLLMLLIIPHLRLAVGFYSTSYSVQLSDFLASSLLPHTMSYKHLAIWLLFRRYWINAFWMENIVDAATRIITCTIFILKKSTKKIFPIDCRKSLSKRPDSGSLNVDSIHVSAAERLLRD